MSIKIRAYDPSEDIFGNALQKVSIRELSKRCGIPESSLYRYRKNARGISLGDFHRIVSALGLPDEKVVQIVKGI